MSKMKFKYEIVHTEKYTDKDGQEQKKYTKLGAVFERPDGSLCAKILDSWVNFYEPKPKASDFKKLQEDIKPAQGLGSLDDLSDDLPF